MTAYYNEVDPVAAAWLRELIAGGLIAPGEVDERDIREVRGDDLKGFPQCHFFAGIGVWSLALRLAGWADDRPVWTGSCPCPPFSSAGKRQVCPRCESGLLVWHPGRTGIAVCAECGHGWAADDRHLWPELRRLVAERRPAIVFGEQVASASGRDWLAGVRGSLEILGHAVGAADLCAAGVGAPHIRQRLFWVADAEGVSGRLPARAWRGEDFESVWCSQVFGGLGYTVGAGSQERRCGSDELLDSGGRPGAGRPTGFSGVEAGWDRSVAVRDDDGRWRRVPADGAGCVEPGLFPLVDAGKFRNRVGLLRGSGNAIVAALAAAFIGVCDEWLTGAGE